MAQTEEVANIAGDEGPHTKVNLSGWGSDHTIEQTGPRQGLNDLAGVDLEIRVGIVDDVDGDRAIGRSDRDEEFARVSGEFINVGGVDGPDKLTDAGTSSDGRRNEPRGRQIIARRVGRRV